MTETRSRWEMKRLTPRRMVATDVRAMIHGVLLLCIQSNNGKVLCGFGGSSMGKRS